jgi:peptide-methionine (S)-S-oxide reductase
MLRPLLNSAGLVTLTCLAVLASPPASSAPSAGSARAAGSSTAPAPAVVDTAIFAGGCFWCVETAFEGRPGVRSVVSGYAGGRTVNPTYEEVGAGKTGHAESVRVAFEPARISYADLLEVFWHSIDPTQADGQFCDKGNQYRSIIFYRNERQQQAALESKRALERSGVLGGKPIVTQIVPAGPFYPAEEYHQDFWKKDPDRYYSYRAGCGRDRRLRELWGDQAVTADRH